MQKNLDIHLKHRPPRILKFFRRSDIEVFTETTVQNSNTNTVDQATSAEQVIEGLTPRNAVKLRQSGGLEVIQDV